MVMNIKGGGGGLSIKNNGGGGRLVAIPPPRIVYPNPFCPTDPHTAAVINVGSLAPSGGSTGLISSALVEGTGGSSFPRAADRNKTYFVLSGVVAGATYQIYERSSTFDCYLYLLSGPCTTTPESTILAENDDSGGGVNGRDSLITYTFSSSGEYAIVASSFSPNITGNFTIEVIRVS